MYGVDGMAEAAENGWVRVSPYSRYLIALGLGDDANYDLACERYKRLLREWHPDRFSVGDPRRREAEHKTKEINNAFNQLRKLKFKFGR